MHGSDEKWPQSIHDEFKSKIHKPKNDSRLGPEKKKIIDLLPEDFVERMDEHLKVEIKYFEKYEKRLPNSEELEAIIMGKIFEEVELSKYILDKIAP